MEEYRFLSWTDYMNLPETVEPWAIEPLIPSGGWLSIYGKPKTGKSLLALSLATAISTKQEQWLGFPVRQHGLVAYFQADNPRSLWRSNHMAKLTTGGFVGNVWFSDPLMMPYPFDVLAEGNLELLQTMLQALPQQPVGVIVDTIREIHEEDENSSGEMRRVLGALRQAADPAFIVLIGHSNKGGGGQTGEDASDHGTDIMDRGRGSSYVPGKMDTIVKLTTRKEDSHTVYGTMHYQGRAAGLSRRYIRMDKTTAHWELDESPVSKSARDLVKQQPGEAAGRLAELLAKEMGISIEAARSRIRRLKGGTK